MPDDQFSPPLPEQLNGWKEIATYLGKSVRAAQRWERELGLPVHRIRTAAGQSIYALRSEIDEWRRRNEVTTAVDEEEDEAADGRKRRRPRASYAALFAAALSIVTAIAVAMIIIREQAAEPVSFEFSGRSFVARDGRGVAVWNYPLPRAPERIGAQDRPQLAARNARRADIDGDGTDEVLAVVRLPPGPDGRREAETLFCWDLHGKVRWKYQPSLKLDFRAGSYNGPWMVLDFVVAHDAHEVWASVGHDTWWAEAIVRIDRNGNPKTDFVHAGLFYALDYETFGGQGRVFAAGASNAESSATLSVIDPAHPPSRWPLQADSPYSCVNCPKGEPAATILLPRTEFLAASGAPFAIARQIEPDMSMIRVVTDEFPDFSSSCLGMFWIEPGLERGAFATSDGCIPLHRHLESIGTLSHHLEDCPQRHGRLIGKKWTKQGGWQDLVFDAVAPPLPQGRLVY